MPCGYAPSWPAIPRAAAMVALRGVLAIVQLAATARRGQIDRTGFATTSRCSRPAGAAVVLRSWSCGVEPAYTLSAAIFLTPFAGNWPAPGAPRPAVARPLVLLAGGIAAVLLRAPAVADARACRSPARTGCSRSPWSIAPGVGLRRRHAGSSAEPFFKLVDAFGIMPFLLFLVAPLAFRTQRQRQVLLVDTRRARRIPRPDRALRDGEARRARLPEVHPRPHYGIHVHRGRGPFVDAVANGLALYTRARSPAPSPLRRGAIGVAAHAGRRGRRAVPGRHASSASSARSGSASCSGPASRCSRRAACAATSCPVAVAAAVAIVAALVVDPGPVGKRHARGQPTGDALGPQEPRPGGHQHGRGKAALRLRLEPLHARQRGLLPAGVRLPADGDEAGVHNTPLTYAVDLGLVGHDALGAGRGVRRRRRARHARAAGPGPTGASGLLAIATAYLVVLELRAADGMAEPLDLALRRRRLQRALPSVVATRPDRPPLNGRA